ncbi:hypothetical protein AKO1_002209 [Acrasis kona]|uniref:Uncharacterized protein n=1 Tax=Acrasis kona TaxID=1008807 RepID=A0AAW2ZNY9_9EUKA
MATTIEIEQEINAITKSIDSLRGVSGTDAMIKNLEEKLQEKKKELQEINNDDLFNTDQQEEDTSKEVEEIPKEVVQPPEHVAELNRTEQSEAEVSSSTATRKRTKSDKPKFVETSCWRACTEKEKEYWVKFATPLHAHVRLWFNDLKSPPTPDIIQAMAKKVEEMVSIHAAQEKFTFEAAILSKSAGKSFKKFVSSNLNTRKRKFLEMERDPFSNVSNTSSSLSGEKPSKGRKLQSDRGINGRFTSVSYPAGFEKMFIR